MAWSYVLKQKISINGTGEFAPMGAWVVFHIGIPDSNSEIGRNYREAALETASPSGVVPSVVRDLENRFPFRYSKLQSGAAVEIVEYVPYNRLHLTLEERKAAIRSRAANIKDGAIRQAQLDMCGLEIDD